ncbi:helix-turn-helix transcriptional regulator [Halomonas sp. ML-15]|uniref:helix-turn-helix transcriptional regulator n=1 Tax=Halomonas sp. ML-15 TaxID=2773305 RepID=UPI00174704EA|nr:helix-turn-helix transcriptional regulator [Halomonas sp. ML-15]MBD3894650.1 helix-turn-helix transcriptional regulator [Halomonas sp. ML-15]
MSTDEFTASPSLTVPIRHSEDLGKLVRQLRAEQGLLQIDLAGLAGTGNRFIVDLERGKPTLQLQKVLDVLDLMGLEVVVRRKGDNRHGE